MFKPDSANAKVMRPTRIFWCHPRLMDYRLQLFRLLSERFEIKFFFRRFASVPHDLDAIYATDLGRINIRGLALSLLGFHDLRALCSGIKWSDVLVSSFIWDSYSIIGLILCKLFKRRVVIWEEMNILRSGFRFRILYALKRKLCTYVDAFFVMGEVQKRTLMRFGVAAKQVFLANEYPGYIYSEVYPREIALPFDRNTSVILYMGRFVEFKGVEYLIRAFGLVEKERDNVALVVVGYGPMREALETMATTRGIRRIYFAGDIPDVHVRSYLLSRCSMVVVPSVVGRMTHEGGPLVVLEALSAGRPVIGTDALGSSADFIHDGANGYVVPQRNERALAEKMKYLLDNPIEPAQVIATFNEIKGHAFQSEQLQKAVRFVLRRSK
jgi:glycosyltransferase involved in cell wall biosynthesis